MDWTKAPSDCTLLDEKMKRSAIEHRTQKSTGELPANRYGGRGATSRSKARKEAFHGKTLSKIATDDKQSQEQHNDRLEDTEEKVEAKPDNISTAGSRTIIFRNLPDEADLSFVLSLVHGGAVEHFQIQSDKTVATVRFIDEAASKAYFGAHGDGILYQHPEPGHEQIISVEQGQRADPISEPLQIALELDATRVVQVSRADYDWSMRALRNTATAVNRRLESIIDVHRNEVSHPFLQSTVVRSVSVPITHLHNIYPNLLSIPMARKSSTLPIELTMIISFGDHPLSCSLSLPLSLSLSPPK